MKLKHLFTCLLALFLLNSCNGDPTPGQVIDQTSEDIFTEEVERREAILDRARDWLSTEDGGVLTNGVPYSQLPGSGPKNEYRADCSGYVSYAWDLEETIPGLYTLTLQKYGVEIPIDDLKSGDILVSHNGNPENHHAVIFIEWSNKDAGSFIAYEENYCYRLENGDCRSEAMRRDDLVLENCTETSCEISGYGADARGPYTAYRKPEIAALSSDTQQVLAAKRSLEEYINEVIEFPELNIPDPVLNPNYAPLPFVYSDDDPDCVPSSGQDFSHGAKIHAVKLQSSQIGGEVKDVVWSPDDKLLVVATDSDVTVLDASTLQVITTLNESMIREVQFTPNGNFLITRGSGTSSTRAKIWRTSDWTVFRWLASRIISISIHPNREEIAISAFSHFEIFDIGVAIQAEEIDPYLIETEAIIPLQNVPSDISTSDIYGARYSPDGSVLVALKSEIKGGRVSAVEILVFDTSSYSFLRRISINHDSIKMNSNKIEENLSVSRDGSVINFLSETRPENLNSGFFREFRSTRTGELLMELGEWHTLAKFSPSEDVFVEDAYGYPFTIWRASDGSIELLDSLCLDVYYVYWLPKGKNVVIHENNGQETYVFDIENKMPLVHIMDEFLPYDPTFDFSHNERYAVSYKFEDRTGEITLWEMVGQ